MELWADNAAAKVSLSSYLGMYPILLAKLFGWAFLPSFSEVSN